MKRRLFIQTLILSSGYILLSSKRLNGKYSDKDVIKILMIYNNIGESATLKKAWGLSVWIKKSNSALLFDTGGDTSIIWENISQLDLDLNKLSDIVISHNHWDHKNGLKIILEKTSNKPTVYVVENDFKEFSEKYPTANIKRVSGVMKIDSDIRTTGKLQALYGGGELYEQSLILTQNDSIVLLTGCSHPGIVNIVKKTKSLFPDKRVELVAGGFHLIQISDSEIMKISNELKELQVNKIAPSHCTGDNAINIFKTEWGEKCINLNIGNEVTI